MGEEDMGPTAFNEFINHEQIHIAQASEMCCIFMYLLWVFDFFRGLMCISLVDGPKVCACACDPKLSYVWNRLEQEAFDHQAEPEYLSSRRCWAWCGYPTQSIAARWLRYAGVDETGVAIGQQDA